jgi:hypothetical protein
MRILVIFSGCGEEQSRVACDVECVDCRRDEDCLTAVHGGDVKLDF